METLTMIVVGGLLASASLILMWGLRKDLKAPWAWLANSLAVTGLFCSTLIWIGCVLVHVMPNAFNLLSKPMLALTAGFAIGLILDQRKAQKKQ